MKPLLLLLALVVTSAAAPDPGEAALGYLEKLRSGKVSLEPNGDTAISPNTQKEKRGEISRRLGRTASDLEGGTLALAATRIDGDLAAAIVCKSDGLDPSRLQVCAVALLLRDERWLPAPVPASFENSSLGFALERRTRARALESWMLQQQTDLLNSARQQLADRSRSDILASISADEVRAMSADQAGLRFIEACAKLQIPVMLALLGGLQPELPEDWASRLRIVNAAAANPAAAAPPWRLLISPEVIRVVLRQHEDAGTGELVLACIDPAGPKIRDLPSIEIINLELQKSAAGLWQVNPPKRFFETVQPEPERGRNRDDADRKDNDLLDDLPAKLRESFPLRPQPDVAAAVTALHEALLTTTPLPLLGLLDLSGPTATARDGLLKAINLWRSLHDPDRVCSPVMLDSVESEQTAAASIQLFSIGEERLDLKVLYFERGEAGWHLLSGLAPDAACGDRFAETSAWAQREAARWTDTWRAKVLADSPVIVNPAAAPLPSDEQTRGLLDAWFTALRGGSLPAMLRLTARLDAKTSATHLLRNLGYEINSARKARIQPAITGISRGKSWVAAAVRTDQADKPVTAVYPVVATPEGPRLLLEADLFISEERGREFLNRASFERLRDTLPASTTDDLREIFTKLSKATVPQ